MKLRAVLGLLRRCSQSAVSGSSQVKPTFAPPTPPVKPGTGGTVPGATQVSLRGKGKGKGKGESILQEPSC